MHRKRAWKNHRNSIPFSSFLVSIWRSKIHKLRPIIATCCPKGFRRHPGTLRGRILTLPGALCESPKKLPGRLRDARGGFETCLGPAGEPLVDVWELRDGPGYGFGSILVPDLVFSSSFGLFYVILRIHRQGI